MRIPDRRWHVRIWLCGLRIILALLAISFAPLHAQKIDPDQPVAAYLQHVWQTQDGLPEANVQALAQTRDGYLWVGTTGGLVRFDGEKFTTFNHLNTPALTVDGVASLMVAHNGDLWIGTFGGGLVRYRDGEFTHYSPGQGFTLGFIRNVVEGYDGTLWVASYGGLFEMKRNHLVRYRNDILALEKSSIFSMTRDETGDLWVGSTTLVRIHRGVATAFPSAGLPPQVLIRSMLVDNNRTLWVGTTSGLFQSPLDSENSPVGFRPVSSVRGGIRSLFLFPNQSLWVGTSNQGSFLLHRDVAKPLSTPAPFPSNAVFTVLKDSNGSFWVGTQAGLVRLAHPETSIIFLPKSSDSVSQTITSDPQGHLWVASTDLYDIRNGHAEAVALPGIAHVHIVTVLRDREGSLWLGTFDQGVYQFKKGHYTHFPMEANLRDVRAIIQSRDGSIWIAGGSGVSRIRNGKIEALSSITRDGGVRVSGAHVLFEDHHGDLWIGADQGLYLWHDGTFLTNSITSAIQNVPVWSMYEASDGTLWIGTDGRGLYRWKDDHVTELNASNHLLPSKIYAILQTHDQEMWISSPNGVYAASSDKLNEFANDPQHPPSARLYTALSGVYTTQLFGGLQPAGAITPDGSLWFPSLYGPVCITAKQQDLNKGIPPVVIRSVLVNGRESSADSLKDLPASSTRLDIQYGAIDLLPQSDLRFRYKLEGFDDRWNDAGTLRSASYTNLPPGRYRLRVVVYSIEAPERISETSLLIRRRPPYYHTWWFFLTCSLFIFCAVYLTHLQRTRQLAQRFRAVIDERNRVAREMHDTLLRGCTGVSSLLEAMASTSQFPEEPAQSLLESARIEISSTIEEARQSIWGLRLDHGGQTNITVLLKESAHQLGQHFDTPIEVRVDGKEVSLRQDVSHHLLMATREALFNALRHGTPSEVRLTIHYRRNQIQIDVTDDGTGFDAENASPRDGREHYGLSVMRERVESIGGTLNIQSAPSRGTNLVMTIPLGRLRNKKDHGANNA